MKKFVVIALIALALALATLAPLSFVTEAKYSLLDLFFVAAIGSNVALSIVDFKDKGRVRMLTYVSSAFLVWVLVEPWL